MRPLRTGTREGSDFLSSHLMQGRVGPPLPPGILGGGPSSPRLTWATACGVFQGRGQRDFCSQRTQTSLQVTEPCFAISVPVRKSLKGKLGL